MQKSGSVKQVGARESERETEKAAEEIRKWRDADDGCRKMIFPATNWNEFRSPSHSFALIYSFRVRWPCVSKIYSWNRSLFSNKKAFNAWSFEQAPLRRRRLRCYSSSANQFNVHKCATKFLPTTAIYLVFPLYQHKYTIIAMSCESNARGVRIDVHIFKECFTFNFYRQKQLTRNAWN